jgi:hypothetical protein
MIDFKEEFNNKKYRGRNLTKYSNKNLINKNSETNKFVKDNKNKT